MIPADVANGLRQILPDTHRLDTLQTQPTLPAQKLADVLSDLLPGQRVMAEIQALLPNGNYRALLAQREITLALPFSAKPGDSLELEVIETEGKVALAFIANRSASAATTTDSVATTLSQAGKLIGDLLGGIDDAGQGAAPAPLNRNQPLVETFPATAAELAPVLKEALSKSGVFYEAHQARWVAGELPTAQLLQEPQGQHSQLRAATSAALIDRMIAGETSADGLSPKAPVIADKTAAHPLADSKITSHLEESELSPENAVVLGKATTPTQQEALAARELPPSSPAAPSTPTDQALSTTKPQGVPIPADLTPLVQQQLDALANQNIAWQGQIWPGQQMLLEINEQQNGGKPNDEDGKRQWQTRLKLSLPQLGDIEANLYLRSDNRVEISMSAGSTETEARLETAATQLKSQFEAAGLDLTQFLIKHGEAAE